VLDLGWGVDCSGSGGRHLARIDGWIAHLWVAGQWMFSLMTDRIGSGF